MVMLVSIASAPYAWFTDEVVVLPAIMLAAYTADRLGRSLFWIIAAAGLALIEVFAGVTLTSGAYGWTAAAWLACSAPLLAGGSTGKNSGDLPGDPIPARESAERVFENA